jgi:ATP-dependent helicase/nuclease subunit A
VPVAGIVAIAGRAPRYVSGQIDRLVVEDDRVLILDFKSDRPVPDEVPDSYAAQLALYRALLARIYPGRRIECALLWTAAGRLDGIAEGRLDAALDRALRMPSLP